MADQVKRIKLTDKDGQEFILAREEGQWLMESHQAMPANQSKVVKTVNDLVNLQVGPAVANTEDAARKLEASSDNYQLEVQLEDDSQAAKLFFGVVPSFKKVYVSSAATQQTFIANLETFNLKPNANSCEL